MNTSYFLPGTDQQLNILLENIEIKDFSALVIGEGSEGISKDIYSKGASRVIMLVQNEESLLRTRMNLSSSKEISVKMMEFDNMDFRDSSFELVYAQASISVPIRNKIIKEVKRILKPAGYLCAGEIVSLTQSPPQFVKDIWNNSNLSPLFSGELEGYYKEKNFEVVLTKDISYTLKEFYQLSSSMLKEKSNKLSADEKSYYKRLLKQTSHESNAYLKFGGNAHMGFKMLLLKKVLV